MQYEVVVDDIELARKYSSLLSKKADINTNFISDLNFLDKSKLKMFDEIIDVRD